MPTKTKTAHAPTTQQPAEDPIAMLERRLAERQATEREAAKALADAKHAAAVATLHERDLQHLQQAGVLLPGDGALTEAAAAATAARSRLTQARAVWRTAAADVEQTAGFLAQQRVEAERDQRRRDVLARRPDLAEEASAAQAALAYAERTERHAFGRDREHGSRLIRDGHARIRAVEQRLEAAAVDA